ncbi:nucleotidyltransferase [Billgrantia antri]|uniref:Nucleotidyltransferase n=1 Tax=Halomonas sulfidivorans TaxID=2733488 RepID=A0ABX7WLI3_9GAMM|nr:nucleotidyltransferase [Halomonas sulfidivorans]
MRELVDQNREGIRRIVTEGRCANPRLFGSVARGDDEPGSDIDILVDTLPGCDLFDLGGIDTGLRELLGVDVDLLTTNAHQIPSAELAEILSESVPI